MSSSRSAGKRDAVAWYNKNADAVARKYESLDPEALHDWLADFLPEPPASVLDVGSGTGRDAAWLVGKGYDVFAVEPSRSMRELARRFHARTPVLWMDDALPGLENTHRTGASFDFILVNAVWAHVPPPDRHRAFRKLANLLKPGGVIALSLRLGPAAIDRGLHAVDGGEIHALARGHGLIVHQELHSDDYLGRDDVQWINFALQVPDDGTDALPLVRHIVLHDKKSSTYKLGLLRSICRIAASSAGLVTEHDDNHVSVPLGLVALTWLRLYKPLLEGDFPQTRANRSGGQGLRFAKSSLEKLRDFSNLDLRVGVQPGEGYARLLHRALRDAAETIREMPATHMTFRDGSPVLPVKLPPRHRSAFSERLVVDSHYLRSFGEMLVPREFWRAFVRFAVWIEPALIEEWARLMRQYAESQNRTLSRDRLAEAMTWSDPSRDVGVARAQAGKVLGSGKLYCVWSGRALSAKSLHVDHCFPWSAWPCSDLWNLMPTNPTVNAHEKRAQIPSRSLMMAAQDRIMSWWDLAYGPSHTAIHERFVIEATSSLPGVPPPPTADLEAVFLGALTQRHRLRHDQQVPEWAGDKYG